MPAAKLRGRTDWDRLQQIRDSDIRMAVKADPDAAPIAGSGWTRLARIVQPPRKQAVSLRLDEDVLQWFRHHGSGYQTRINAVLREYIESKR